MNCTYLITPAIVPIIMNIFWLLVYNDSYIELACFKARQPFISLLILAYNLMCVVSIIILIVKN